MPQGAGHLSPGAGFPPGTRPRAAPPHSACFLHGGLWLGPTVHLDTSDEGDRKVCVHMWRGAGGGGEGARPSGDFLSFTTEEQERR